MIEPKDIERYQRELRAMVLRAGDEDPEGFAAIDQLLRKAVHAMPAAAEMTRRRHGYSWIEIARGLGVTKQGAMRRLAGRPELRHLTDVDLRHLVKGTVRYSPAEEQREAS